MWNAIVAELKYNKYLIGLFILLTLVFKMSIGSNGEFDMMIVMAVFFTVHFMTTKFVKEKRERSYMALPVSAVRIAWSRISLIIIPAAAIFFFVLLGKNVLIISLLGLYLLGYIVFYIMRDILVGRYTTKNVNRSVIPILFGLLILGQIILLIQTREAYNSQSPPLFLRIIDYFFSFIGTGTGIISIYGIIALLSIASIYSYSKRKQYI
jgi:hypothetical protein